MDFSKNKTQNQEADDDAYIADIKNKMKIKQSEGVINQQFDIYYQTTNEDMSKWVNFRILNNLLIWGYVLVGVSTFKVIYPISLRQVKKYLKLQGFLNLNMASVPPVLIACGFTWGIYAGAIDIYLSKKEVEEYKK